MQEWQKYIYLSLLRDIDFVDPNIFALNMKKKVKA